MSKCLCLFTTCSRYTYQYLARTTDSDSKRNFNPFERRPTKKTLNETKEDEKKEKKGEGKYPSVVKSDVMTHFVKLSLEN